VNILGNLTTNTYNSPQRTLLQAYPDTTFTPVDTYNTIPGDILSSSYSGQYVSFVGKSTIYVSNGYGASLTQLVNTTSGITYYSIQMSISGQYQVAVSQSISVCNIYVYTDYGVSFVNRRTVSTNNPGRWVMSISLSSTEHIAGGGGAGVQLYHSNDFGANFTLYGGLYNRISSVMLNNAKIITLNDFNDNIITVSPLTNTTETLTATLSYAGATRICTNGTDHIVLIITSATNYWYSSDSGASFTAKTGFPTNGLYAKFVDNTLYACSPSSVHKSVHYGVSFIMVDTGLTIQCFTVNSYAFFLLDTSGRVYWGFDDSSQALLINPTLKISSGGVNTEYVSDNFRFYITNSVLYVGGLPVSMATASVGAYFQNPGVSTFPIFSRINDFSAFEMDLFIKGDHDSIILLPSYAIFLFSEKNQGGKFLSIGNRTINVEYYPISSAYRVKSCVLYKYDLVLEAYAEMVFAISRNRRKHGINMCVYIIYNAKRFNRQ
jgi:hypothetical protein